MLLKVISLFNVVICCEYIYLTRVSCSFSGSQAEADRTHAERETHPASCQLSFSGAIGTLFQGIHLNIYLLTSASVFILSAFFA